MLFRPTVFVVGAGASIPFGFPSGLSLLREAKALRPDDITKKTNRILNPQQVEELSSVLRDCQEESIDAMLEQQEPILQAAGKRIIAQSILRAEFSSRGGNARDGGDWFQYLFSRMAEGVSALDAFISKNDVTFITYNYDRLIEYKLMAGLRAKFKANDDLWPTITDKIIHLHGSLGTLFKSTDYVPFGAIHRTRPSAVLDAAINEYLVVCERTIKIVHEPKPDGESFDKARAALRRAHAVFFLGFGFGRTNVDRLDFQCIKKDAAICYTRKGMTEQELRLYIREPLVRCDLGNTRKNDNEWDSLALLREHAGELVTRY
jgi:hypothetical protein